MEHFISTRFGFIYTRLGNPTVSVLEQKIAAFESAEAGLAFGSGMAAISAVLFGLVPTSQHCSRVAYYLTLFHS